MRNHTSQVQTRPAPDRRHLSLWSAGLLMALILMAGMARAEDDLIVTHGVSTFGDLRYGPDFEHLDYVNPDAPKGGEISFGWSTGSFDSMHPYTREGRPAVLSSIFFEAMLESTADEIGSAYGLLAESIAYPEDRSYVIFTIREEARFSDGTPVTADDALFGYEILRDDGLPSFRAQIGRTISGAQVLDDRRIRFDFNPTSPLRGRIVSAGGLPVISRASHEASGLAFSESRLEPLIGSAPYILEEVEPGQRVVYARNPDYWGNDLPINRGRNNFDRIRIEYYGDAVAAFEGFTAGNYLFRQESSSSNWATAYDFPALEQGYVVQAELPDGTISTGQSFIINLRREQFQDVRVREAIALMFNFEWTNQTLFYGLYVRNDSFWQNTDLAATGLPGAAELALLDPLRDQLRPEVFTEDPFSLPASTPDRALDRRQARRAIGLLEEAGWIIGDDGLARNAAGQTLDVEFLNSGLMFDRLINPYVENLRAVGINARLTRVDSAQMTQRERDHDFDIITDHIPMGYEPGAGLRQYFGSETANDSVFNAAGLADPAVDVLIEHVVNAETQEELNVAVSALDRVLRWERFRVPQWFNDAHWVAYYDIYRYPEPLPPYALGFLDFWWVDAEAEAALRAAGAF
ncbi:ABC transporter substrate-binding protein [Rhodophyticola sp. CCM32]|uniref:extracellular solute-binding protein n=1 Tax=Rhodophyticola sp. CCM32 TaxID=2916397 RepID=UPI00107FA974|nr:extracellular solute-binding protein [Rhodophyticola sp. CCM32]QBY01648.1 ABC transporter substrate-binding protein [Rhodophyticola sp. CCM32]